MVNPVKITILFTWYIVADFLWILVEPSAVPSLPNVILLHHAVTFILLCFPLRYASLATYTCWDGICEINTFFLIARRQWKSVRKPFSFLYWATFFPMRIFLYPYMLVLFYREMQAYALWELIAVCGSQVALIAFNVVLLMLSITNWKKRPNAGRTSHTTQQLAQGQQQGQQQQQEEKKTTRSNVQASTTLVTVATTPGKTRAQQRVINAQAVPLVGPLRAT